MTIRTARLLAATAAIALASPAFAQDAEGGEDIVVTAQRDNRTQVERGGNLGALGDKPAEDVPFAIKSYSETLILNQQPQTLGQVLENDPSIRTGFSFGNAAELFIIRGFPLFGDDIAMDGLYGVTPRQLIAPELYSGVQVLNGASAFLNGAAPGGSGLGGSVNLQLKRAETRPLTRVTANFTEGSHFGGAFDVARRFGDGALGVRVNGAYRAGDVSIDDEFRRTAVIGAGIDWRGERARLFADIAYQRVEIDRLRHKVTLGAALTQVPEPPAADHNYAQPWTYTTLEDVFGVVRGEYDLSDNAMVYAAFGARDGSEEGVYGGITVTDAVTGAATGSGSYIPRTDNNEAAQAGLRVKLAGGGISHEINFGGSMIWQVNRNAYDFFAGDFATNLYDTPVVAQPPSGFAGGDLDDPFPLARTRLGSAFASNTIGFLDDRVLLTGGLRLQTVNVRSYAYADGSLDTEYDEDAITPVVGLVVKPVAGLSLYANRIEGLAQGPTAPIDDSLVNSGEVFAPFVSVQYEAGGKLSLGRFNASLAVFQTEQPSSFSRPVDADDPDGPRIFVVEGEQRNRGIELSLDGEPVRGLRVIGGASITEAKLVNTGGGANEGNTAVGVPDYTINANVEWDLPFVPGATLTGRLVNTGAQWVDAANTLEIPGWTRFDLGARYVVAVADRPLTLRLTVDNVANERYWQSAYDSFSPSVLQGTPRTVKLSASIDL